MERDKKKILNIKKILDFAIENHRKNNLKTAEQLYNEIIELEPEHLETIFLLGSLSIQTKNFDRAQQLLNKVIQIDPGHAKAHNNLGALFQELKKNKEAIFFYEKAIKINPKLPDTYCNLSLLYMNSGKHEEALKYCNEALSLIPQMLKAINLKSEILKKNTPHWHTQMINDEERNNFYFSALKSFIKTDSNVLEIGTGSGLLSIMAANLGANEINTCETNSIMANTAKNLVADNNLSERINIIKKKSTDIKIGVDINKPANILVSEIFSSNLLSEDVLPSLEDAKQRLISKKAKIIPEYGSIMIALFGGDDIGKNIYTEKFKNIKLKKFNSIISKKYILHRQDLKVNLMSDKFEAFRFDFVNKNNFPSENKKIEIEASKAGRSYGVIQWIKMEMDDGLKYENHPSNPTVASGWQRILYLFDDPIELSIGEKVGIHAKHERNLVWFFLEKIKK
ncbi:MAG: tetratricopeptide repeat protein [Candidatus Pelagibacterales bacterium]|nr:MAG: tetratricopeptide repeat protein [Pelagibacterales bacterium]